MDEPYKIEIPKLPPMPDISISDISLDVISFPEIVFRTPYIKDQINFIGEISYPQINYPVIENWTPPEIISIPPIILYQEENNG